MKRIDGNVDPYIFEWEEFTMDNWIMSPEEFAEAMRMCSSVCEDDVEMRHLRMDGLMLELLAALGYSEGVDIFMNTSKWYA